MHESQIVLDPLQSLKNTFLNPLRQIDKLILDSVSGNDPLIKTIATTLISAGGKRLRPMLCLASSELTGKIEETTRYLAASVELIHAATLLHDDVVDESHLRRGKQTANVSWGNKPSILVGDFLFARAFELMVKTGDIRYLDILATASSKIIEGEVTQLRCMNSLNLSIEDYLKLIEYKTSTLFAASCKTGALSGGGTEEEASLLHDFGKYFGLMYQILDDVLDYTDDRRGKNKGDDFREGKVTFPILLAYQADNDKVFWHNHFNGAAQTDSGFDETVHHLNSLGAFKKSIDVAATYGKKAQKCLDPFESSVSVLLNSLVDYLLQK